MTWLQSGVTEVAVTVLQDTLDHQRVHPQELPTVHVRSTGLDNPVTVLDCSQFRGRQTVENPRQHLSTYTPVADVTEV
jgi:hypothetical protein